MSVAGAGLDRRHHVGFAICLRLRYVVSGTDPTYDAARWPSIVRKLRVVGTLLDGHQVPAFRFPVLISESYDPQYWPRGMDSIDLWNGSVPGDRRRLDANNRNVG